MKYMKIFCNLIFALLIAITTHGQSCLKKKKQEIIKITKMYGGIIKRNQDINKYGFSFLTIEYPDNIGKQKGKYFSKYEFKNKICFRSTDFYVGKNSIQDQINNLDNEGTGYKRIGKDLFWINKEKRIQIEISNFLRNDWPTPRFYLEASVITKDSGNDKLRPEIN